MAPLPRPTRDRTDDDASSPTESASKIEEEVDVQRKALLDYNHISIDAIATRRRQRTSSRVYNNNNNNG